LYGKLPSKCPTPLWLSDPLAILIAMAGKRAPLQRAQRLASRQDAAINRKEALDAGLTRDHIDTLLRSGRWIRAKRGVYTLAGVQTSWQQRTMVALLAAPTATVASHLTAAALFGLTRPPDAPELTARTPTADLGIAQRSKARTAASWIGSRAPSRPAPWSTVPASWHHGPRRWQADDTREDRIEALGWRIEPVDKFDRRPSSTRLRQLLAPLLLQAA
jgi:Transcriptional regulator, AbiEi antitoxin